jgi:hypothetical protein
MILYYTIVQHDLTSASYVTGNEAIVMRLEAIVMRLEALELEIQYTNM